MLTGEFCGLWVYVAVRREALALRMRPWTVAVRARAWPAHGPGSFSLSLSLSLLVSGSRTVAGHHTSGSGGAGRRKGLSSMRLGGLRGSGP